MKRTIETEIVIKANPVKVWNVLMEFEQYPDWNPFIKYIQGKTTVGNKIEVKICPPNSKAMLFKPVITKNDSQKEFRWLGKLLFKGLFDGEHYFILQDNNDGTTTFKQGENFSGILLFLLNIENTKAGFELMNEKLKEKVERI